MNELGNKETTYPPFFVVGCDRSGTTLLRLMLNAHPRIDIPNESDFIAHLIERGNYEELENPDVIERIFQDLVAVERLRNWGIDLSRLKHRILSGERSLRNVISAPFEIHMEEKGKKRWGDKTPRYTRYIKEIKKIFPDALFIHLIRDGRDVAASLKKVTWFSNNIFDISHHWKTYVKEARHSREYLGDQYMELHYEDLVENPRKTLNRVCKFLNENYDDRMLEYWRDPANHFNEMYRGDHGLLASTPTTMRVKTWESELSKKEVLLFEHFAGEELKTSGYEISICPSTQQCLQIYSNIFLHHVRNRSKNSFMQLRKAVFVNRCRN